MWLICRALHIGLVIKFPIMLQTLVFKFLELLELWKEKKKAKTNSWQAFGASQRICHKTPFTFVVCYVRVWEQMCVVVYMHVYSCVWRLEVVVKHPWRSLGHILLRQCLFLNPELTALTSHFAPKFLISAFCMQELGAFCQVHLVFTWVLKMLTLAHTFS